MTTENKTTATTTGAGTIVVLNRDLLFGMRIRNVAKSLGYEVEVVGTTSTFVAKLTGEPHCALGIIDINAGVDWSQIARATSSSVPILAFGPHRDVEGLRAAKQAGVRRVISNGEFQRDLPGLINRYAQAVAPDESPSP